MNSLIAAAMAVATLSAPALAFAHPAQTQDGLRQVVVSFADLNLNTPAGQAELKTRIHRAAVNACGAQPDNKDLRALKQFKGCVQQSTGAATAAVPATSLVAGSNGHNG